MILSSLLFCLMNQGRTKREGWSTANQLKPPPSNFIAGRPKAALLFWFFGDFRCDMQLFIDINIIGPEVIKLCSCSSQLRMKF